MDANNILFEKEWIDVMKRKNKSSSKNELPKNLQKWRVPIIKWWVS